MRRVGVFIDVANQVSSLNEKKKGHRVNYAKYLDFVLSEGDRLILAVAYGTQVTDEATNFIHVLKRLGYITKFKSRSNRNVEIVLDILNVVNKLDLVVLGSSDCDLVPLIHALRMRGLAVLVASPFLTHNEGSANLELDENVIEHIQVVRDKR